MIKFKYTNICQIWKNWNKIDKSDYFKTRLHVIKNCDTQNYHECYSSGTSSCMPKKYKWGPNFDFHKKFYDNLFYGNQEYMFCFIHEAHKSQYFIKKINGVVRLTLQVNQFFPKNQEGKIQHLHVCLNPEVLFLFMTKYGCDFLFDFFDTKTCIFSFTCSELKEEHKKLFSSLDLKFKDHMRCWDGGATFYTCQYFNKHWLEISSILSFEQGKLISTDLWNCAQKFINYWNYDMVESIVVGECECGLDSIILKWKDNPRFFTIKGRQFLYDSVAETLKLELEYDFLSIEYSDDLIYLNLSTNNQFNKEKMEAKFSDIFKTKVVIKIMLIPPYERKHVRIKKIN